MGSGYGKAVLHFALSQRLRRAVGIECVISRHEIAQQALLEVRATSPGYLPLRAIFPGYHRPTMRARVVRGLARASLSP